MNIFFQYFKRVKDKLLSVLYYINLIILFFIFPKILLRYCLGPKIFKQKSKYIKKNLDENFTTYLDKFFFNEVNLICRGHSYQVYKDKINFNLPTFFVNFYDNKQIDSGYQIIDEKDNFYGITADIKIKGRMKKLFKKTILILPGYDDNQKIFSYWEEQETIDNDVANFKNLEIFEKLNNQKILVNFHSSNIQIDLGSALLAGVFLSKISKKINYYGYDHHFPKKIESMNYYEILKNSWNERTKLHAKPIKLTFIKSLINYYFSYEFENDSRFNIYSNLKNISSKNFLINRLKKIFIEPI